jgi:hypothetical protein
MLLFYSLKLSLSWAVDVPFKAWIAAKEAHSQWFVIVFDFLFFPQVL